MPGFKMELGVLLFSTQEGKGLHKSQQNTRHDADVFSSLFFFFFNDDHLWI